MRKLYRRLKPILSGLALAVAGAANAQTPAAASPTGGAPGVSQGEPAYRKEFTYGITSNSNSGLIGGGSIRSTHYYKPDWYWFWQLEVTEVKNPKELRVQSALTGDQYIRGKTNYLYAVRPSFGLERIVFHKAAEQGVQVSGLVSGGPSIGLEVPYYILYDYDPDPKPPVPVDIRKERYEPDGKHNEPSRIAGSASFLTGFGETRPNIGAHLRGALAFEYGRYREGVTGLEAGFTVEAYARRPILMPSANRNPQLFTAVYLTLFLGRRS